MSIVIAVAPDVEQAQILKFITTETTPLRTTISRLTNEVDLLREYRTRLVADVVTGKFDVREAAKNLPEESTLELPVDEADLIDESEPLEEEAAE